MVPTSSFGGSKWQAAMWHTLGADGLQQAAKWHTPSYSKIKEQAWVLIVCGKRPCRRLLLEMAAKYFSLRKIMASGQDILTMMIRWHQQAFAELYKIKEVPLKFNSHWLTARATKVQFICQKLNFNFSQLMDELFWVATQMKFRENEVPPAEREEELSFFLVMTTKYCSSFPFYRGTLLSLWTSLELHLK